MAMVMVMAMDVFDVVPLLRGSTKPTVGKDHAA